MKYYLALLVSFVLVQFYVSSYKPTDREKIFISPSEKMVHFTFGYNDFLSSMLWVRVVQDFHICDQNSEKSKFPSPRADVDPVTDTLTRQLPEPTCEEGWVYKMLDVITDISPDFKRVYYDGGTMLSVLVDDRIGAKKIYDKGQIHYPEDWNILYRSAYHELFEMQNGEKAAELLVRAGQRGAPQWVFSLAAKLHTRYGKAVLAKGILESILARDRAGEFSDRLKTQLEKINEVLEKEAASEK